MRPAVLPVIALLAAGRAAAEEPPPLDAALDAEDACSAIAGDGREACELSLRQLRGLRTRAAKTGSAVAGAVSGVYRLTDRYNLGQDPHKDFDVVAVPDKGMTHSCANYTDDGTTVFTRDGKLVLKVASACKGGVCLNSGRVMSKRAYKYGIFTWSAKVPKCNFLWPALWLLPGDTGGNGPYGPWPCSGEIDVLETVNADSWGAHNVVAGYGATRGTCSSSEITCNKCVPPAFCTSTTFNPGNSSWYHVEKPDCSAARPSWKEHTFALSWQPGRITTWVDPVFTWDAYGHLVKVEKGMRAASAEGLPSFKEYMRDATPTWTAVERYMKKCYKAEATSDAPFDAEMKIVMNIAVGGYGGAPCVFGARTCSSACGGAIGSELVLSDISVWQQV